MHTIKTKGKHPEFSMVTIAIQYTDTPWDNIFSFHYISSLCQLRTKKLIPHEIGPSFVLVGRVSLQKKAGRCSEEVN